LKSSKRHDSREREGKSSDSFKQERMGGFLRHNTTVKHHWYGRCFRIMQCQTPVHCFCRRHYKLLARCTIRKVLGS
jgi:hypothetical protein